MGKANVNPDLVEQYVRTEPLELLQNGSMHLKMHQGNRSLSGMLPLEHELIFALVGLQAMHLDSLQAFEYSQPRAKAQMLMAHYLDMVVSKVNHHTGINMDPGHVRLTDLSSLLSEKVIIYSFRHQGTTSPESTVFSIEYWYGQKSSQAAVAD